MCKGISQIIVKLMYGHHKRIVHARIGGMELRWPAQVPHSYSDHGRVASVTLVGDTPGCKYKLETQHKYDSVIVTVDFSLGVVHTLSNTFFFNSGIWLYLLKEIGNHSQFWKSIPDFIGKVKELTSGIDDQFLPLLESNFSIASPILELNSSL